MCPVRVPGTEGTHDLAANFIGHDKHAQRHEFSVGEIPDLLLQRDASAKLFNAVTAT